MLFARTKTFHKTLVASLAGALLAALAQLACSSDTGVTGTLPPCSGTSCTKSCSSDAQCPTGNYCNGTTCARDCTPGAACGAGMTCSANGRCTAPGGGGSGTGGGTGSGGTTGIPVVDSGVQPDSGMMDADACAESSVDFTSEPPNVLLLVDRSGSMSEELADDESRWVALRNALIDPTNGIVPRLQSNVNLGLALYTGPDRGFIGRAPPDGGTSPDFIETEECPYLVEVPIASNNAAAIQAAYVPEEIAPMSNGQTPTGDSLAAVVPTLTALDPALYPGRKVIVLATDGEPDLCENGNDEAGGRLRSVTEVGNAFDQGITVFVISVGDQVGEAHLRELANVGQGFPANDMTERFYRANDAAQLEQAFEDIVTGVRACIVALDGTVSGTGADGTVTLDGTPLVKDDPNGWRLNGPSEVELLGSSCELLKSGDHSIDISFPCGVFIEDPT